MFGAALIGLIAAGVVAVPRCLYLLFPEVPWFSPILILGIGIVALFLQKFVLKSGANSSHYHGLADLLIHVHSPLSPDSTPKWFFRGFLSFLLTVFGGVAGPEGVAAEWALAIQIRTRFRMQKWFEQSRRTYAAIALASGVAAAFGAPFAAVIFPIELGIGGRTILTVISALIAFMGSQFLNSNFSLDRLDIQGVIYSFHLGSWREWLATLILGILGGISGVILLRFIRYTQMSLQSLFQTQAWTRVLTGSGLLFLIYFIYQSAHQPSWVLLEQVIWSKFSAIEVSLLLFTQFLSLTVVLSGFGTIGILWPLFALGGFFGFCVNHWVLTQFTDLGAVASLAGAAALWSAVLGAPVSATLLALELTQNLQVIVPCLATAFIGHFIRQRLMTQSLPNQDLDLRGVVLISGKSKAVLDSISFRDIMVSDFDTAAEHDSASELQAKFHRSAYPFVPVVNNQGIYKGLLVADMLKDIFGVSFSSTSNSSLSRVLEAKDVLYRLGFKSPTVKLNDRLSDVISLFEDSPCIPVLSSDDRVVGLVFPHHIRFAYEREVARRSFLFVRSNEG